ncbi:C40 family peptidase [Peptostreptococcus faecalis]|uniref:C40 family peptidase n=1 Tax=Peptostreptococcus faecalis TaxID=2045015 RepID=UPI000C7CE51E|nr:NlpC/P60 family protein [Peptostreptococcus faecalis]
MQFKKGKNKNVIAIVLATFIISSSFGEAISLADNVEQTEYISATQTQDNNEVVDEGIANDNISDGSVEGSDSNNISESLESNNAPNNNEEKNTFEVSVEDKAIKGSSGGFNGFVKENGKWYFYVKNVQTKGWVNYNGNKYYIINTYQLPQNMWRTINGKRYFFNKDGVMVKDQKIKIDNKVYQFNKDGHMITPNNSKEVGVVTKEQENLYKLGEETLSKASSTVKNGLLKEGGKWYKYENGKKTRGWFQEGKNKYYFLNTFNRAENMWRTINGVTYYFGQGGVMYANTIKYIDGKTCKFNADGSLNTSVKTDIVLNNVAVKKSADNNSQTVGNIYKGSGVEIISNSGSFVKVKSGDGSVEGWVPNTTFVTPAQEKINKVIAVAKSKIGARYVWGATGPNTFDCSGLMLYSFKNGANVSLPRVSRDQATVGSYVSKNDLKAGDLIFWGSPVHHVGLYIGDGKYIHAPQPGTTVTIAKLGQYTSARRVIK